MAAQVTGRSRPRTTGRNAASTIKSRLALGAKIAAYFERNPDVGHRRWRAAADHCRLQYNSATTQRLRRAYREWSTHGREGMCTDMGSGAQTPSNGGVAPRERRRRAFTRLAKTPELGFELVQWYVDEVESLRSRADSTLLMRRAQKLREMLQDQHIEEAKLPRVDKHWLRRWRIEYGITMRSTTVRFKVNFATARERIKVMLSNIFRLRRLWELSFGSDVPMRWASYDQKPSWFNNAGLMPGRFQ